jgi:sensor histidine kinase YesM
MNKLVTYLGKKLLNTKYKRKITLILLVSLTYGFTFFISSEFSLRLDWTDFLGFLVEILLFTLQIEVIYRLRSYFDHRFHKAPVSTRRYSLEMACVLLSSIVLVTVLIVLPLYTMLEVMDLDEGAVPSAVYVLLIRQLYLMPITFTLLLYILISAYYAVKKLNQLELEAERLQRQRMQEMFESLRNQINPQFLFNSLRSLSQLIYRDKEGAARFVDELSAVYRYILDHRDKELIELHKELAFIRSYLFLLSMRHQENIQCTILQKGETFGYYLPPQTLQIVLDNVIRYHNQNQIFVLHIEIEINKEYLVIKNNRPAQEKADKNSLLGLREIISRYRYLTEQKISYISTDHHFIIHIPLLELEPALAVK